MTFAPHFPDGYYDKNGEWQRTKFCFISCGAACTCMPPFGLHYSEVHDQRKRAPEGVTTGGAGSTEGSGCEGGVQASDGVHLPVEATDAPSKGVRKHVSE